MAERGSDASLAVRVAAAAWGAAQGGGSRQSVAAAVAAALRTLAAAEPGADEVQARLCALKPELEERVKAALCGANPRSPSVSGCAGT